jgi:hypothetical protein
VIIISAIQHTINNYIPRSMFPLIRFRRNATERINTRISYVSSYVSSDRKSQQLLLPFLLLGRRSGVGDYIRKVPRLAGDRPGRRLEFRVSRTQIALRRDGIELVCIDTSTDARARQKPRNRPNLGHRHLSGRPSPRDLARTGCHTFGESHGRLSTAHL